MLLLLAAAGVAAVVWLFVIDDRPRLDIDAADEPRQHQDPAAVLRGTPGATTPKAEGAEPVPSPDAADEAARAESGDAPPFLSGLVVDAEDGSPIAGATIVLEPARDPLDRVPTLDSAAWFEHGLTVDLVTARASTPSVLTSDEGGEFRIATPPGGAPRVDVFVFAPGRLAAASGPHVSGERVVVRLEDGLHLRGVVRGPRGRPLEGALLVSEPAPGTRPSFRHIALARSDADGRFELGALAAGDVIVRCECRGHVSARSAPVDPAAADPIAFDLAATFLVTFELAPIDAVEPIHPAVEYTTSSPDPARGLVLLRAPTDTPPEGKQPGLWTYEPIVVPCRGTAVSFTVKAERHAPWTSEPIDLPIDGGMRTLQVPLATSPDFAEARVRFRQRDGTQVAYGSLRAALDLIVLERQALEAGAVVEGGEVLVLRSVPQGRYRLIVRSPDYAPVTVDVDARPYEQEPVEATLDPGAKVRVVFRSREPMVVPFRIYEEGRAIVVFPEEGRDTEGNPSLVGGREGGDVFTGLGSGTYEIVVSSDELVAPPTTFRTRAGETTDVEIDVARR